MIGLYGPEVITWLTGGIGRNLLCTVYLRGTTTKALLYIDENGFSGIENPISSDQYGRITFYTELGEYDLVIAGVSTPIEITVPSGGAVDHLDELDDVSVAGATADQVLGFNGTVWIPVDQSGGGGGSTPDATSLVKGKLRLTGDLGGTADAPTVPGLAGKQPTGDYATNTALTNGLATKQPAGSYATTTQLTNGLATKQDSGDYATNTALTSGLAGKQNTGDYALNSAVSAKYTKPGPGIPSSDLTAAAQTSLGKADTAVQPGALATVATSGAYTDLTGKPALFSGAYSDLSGKPTLSTVAGTGAYADLTGKPTLSTVAGTGAYNDLTGKPDLTVLATKAFVDSIVGLTDAATVATDAAAGKTFTVTLGGNRTLGVPTNPADGMTRTWRFRQDATGTRTITLASGTGGFVLGSQIANTTLNTAANKVGYMTAIYDSSYPGGARWCVLAFEPGV